MDFRKIINNYEKNHPVYRSYEKKKVVALLKQRNKGKFCKKINYYINTQMTISLDIICFSSKNSKLGKDSNIVFVPTTAGGWLFDVNLKLEMLVEETN